MYLVFTIALGLPPPVQLEDHCARLPVMRPNLDVIMFYSNGNLDREFRESLGNMLSDHVDGGGGTHYLKTECRFVISSSPPRRVLQYLWK